MNAIVQFRMDKELKENFEQCLRGMGLDMGSAFRLFATQVLNKGKIPFEIEVYDDTIWTKADEKAWREARRDLENGETISLDELKRKYGL